MGIRFTRTAPASGLVESAQPAAIPAVAAAGVASPRTGSDRLLAIDIARGITMAFMIMVNNHGAAPWHQFQHSQWNGWTFTDLVFPCFIFLVGISIVLSFDKRLSRGTPKRKIAASIVRRTVILFALGLVVNGYPHFPLGTLRIYGVLQRIALCYLCAGLFYLWRRDAASKVAAIVALLAGYYILMRLIPVPGAGMPTKDIPLLDPTQNWTAWVDRHLLAGRLYEGVRDPEGLLSTFPAIATSLIGVLTGLWLRAKRPRTQIAAGLLGFGVLLVVLGELWNPFFPINKKLWTSSYVLFSGGTSLLLTGLLYWMIDVLNWRRVWMQPWIVFGTNAIFGYMLSELLASTLSSVHLQGPHGSEKLWTAIYTIFRPIHPAGLGSLIYSICFMLVCWIITYPLWRKRIFLKI